MRMTWISVILILILNYEFVLADRWAFLSKHKEMEGYGIVEVGEARYLAPTYNDTWSDEVYELCERCLLFPDYGDIGALVQKLPYYL